MDRDDALRKIKACLALSRDWRANQNERDIALRQAQFLLKQYKGFIDFETFLTLLQK